MAGTIVPAGSLGEMSMYLGNLNQTVETLKTENQSLQSQIDALGRLTVSEVTEDWLQIPFRFVAFASGATGVLTRTVAGDGPFDLVEVTYTSIDSTGTPNTSWRVRVKEGEAVGRALTQDAEYVDLTNTAGTAQLPYIIKGRRRFRANIAIQVEVTNVLAGPATNNLEFCLHGIKVFTR